MALKDSKCVPCHGGMLPLARSEAEALAAQTPEWTLEEKFIEREFRLKDFAEAIRFIVRVAAVAEAEDHHPDIHNYYSRVVLELSTHKVGGLTQNDFILAAKIDALLES